MSRKRIVLVYLGTLLALLTVTWLVLRESGIARSFVQQGLASVLEAKRFRFRTASIDAMSGTVRIAGLNVTTAEPGLIADIGSLAIGISTHPLRQPGQLRSVDLTDARLEIDLRDGRRPDWQSLLAARDDPDRSVSTLPAVALIDSTVVVHAERGRAPLTFAVDRLTATPLADAPERHVLEGTVRLVAGLPLAVRGTVSAAGGLEVRLSAADAPLAARDLAAIDPKLADQLAEIVTSSRIASFDAELGITPDGEVTWRVATVLDRLGFSSQHVPHAIQDATMRIWGDEAAGGTLRFDLDSESTYGDLRATGEWTGMYAAGSAIDVRLEADGVLVRPELGRALAPIDEAREVWDAFEPDGGRASAIARYRRDADGEQRFDLDLGLDGIGARFVGFESRSGARTYGFPHPLTDIHGTVRVRRGIVDVTDVRAAIAGRPLQVRGTVDISERGRPPRIALDFDAESLAFTAPLRDALAVLDRGSAQVWDRFEPAGDAGLQVRLRTDGSGGADVRVRIEPLLASARFAGFPCRVDQIRGAGALPPPPPPPRRWSCRECAARPSSSYADGSGSGRHRATTKAARPARSGCAAAAWPQTPSCAPRSRPCRRTSTPRSTSSASTCGPTSRCRCGSRPTPAPRPTTCGSTSSTAASTSSGWVSRSASCAARSSSTAMVATPGSTWSGFAVASTTRRAARRATSSCRARCAPISTARISISPPSSPAWNSATRCGTRWTATARSTARSGI